MELFQFHRPTLSTEISKNKSYDVRFEFGPSVLTPFVQFLRMAGFFNNNAAVERIFGNRLLSASERYTKAVDRLLDQLGDSWNARRLVFFDKSIRCSSVQADVIETFYADSGYAEYHHWMVNELKESCERLLISNNDRKATLAQILSIQK